MYAFYNVFVILHTFSATMILRSVCPDYCYCTITRSLVQILRLFNSIALDSFLDAQKVYVIAIIVN